MRYDRSLFMIQRYDDWTEDFAVSARARNDGPRTWAVLAAFIVSLAVVSVFLRPIASIPAQVHGERKERSTGREFLAETDVQMAPIPSVVAPGWDSERVWSGHDDWEPFLAADRSSTYVYQMVTRFNAQVSGIFIRRLADGGASWLADQLIAPINIWQADPQVQVADDGTVFAVWLDGPQWMSKLVKSYDHGATWTAPIVIAPALPWTDHPWLLVSPDGNDVYVGLNMDDSYIVTSHDGGQTFGTPYKTNAPTPGHWWDANGAAMAPDGTPYFSVINFFLNYRGIAQVHVVMSHDRGRIWLGHTGRYFRAASGLRRRAGLQLRISLHHRGACDRQERQVASRLSCGQPREGAANDVDYHFRGRDQLDAAATDFSA